MKLRNKTTGEIRNAIDIDMYTDSVYLKVSDGEFDNETIEYHSLAELNEEWEDYEEPTYYYFIQDDGRIGCDAIEQYNHKPKVVEHKEIGNYFETREEAEKAVEKLKAWKRLKNKGFRFNGWKCTGSISFAFDNYCGDGQPMSASDDLNLLFGGEE